MSNMLEQAIIDADALKEAAVRNAETLVLEKFSNQIKSAVETLLEQDMPPMPGLDIPDMPPGLGPGPEDPTAMMGGLEEEGTEEEVESSVMEHLPNAATTRKDEIVEVPLDALMEEINLMSQKLQFGGDSVTGDLEFDNLISEVDDALEEEELEEEVDLDEDLLDNIAEQLVVDHMPVGSGWAGTPESLMELAEEELLALEQDSEMREKKEAIRKSLAALENVNETVIKQNTRLQGSLKESTGQINKLMRAVGLLKEKLDSVNLTNAKLLYQNKAMGSDSLNERQKRKLVEAISNADNIDEAKVIFETLQGTVGSTSRKKQPKSLSEAVETSSSVILSSRKRNSGRQKKAPAEFDRWKFLAGIK